MTEDEQRRKLMRDVGGTPDADREAGISAGQFAGLGLQFAVAIIVFLYAGQWLDRKLGTEPWFLIIGVFTGAGLAFFSMYRKLMAEQTREEARRQARMKPK